ncbi:MAG: hypothetical protein JF607_01210 [Burkholderiales bacterium]|nr:hypothetical protein [Burkholderiales bacterium]
MAEVIRADWAEEPSMREACLNILQALTSAEGQLDHYSFNKIQEFAAVDDDKVVARAATYLSNANLQVLRTCLMYEYRGYFFELPKEELQHYVKDEDVVHPESGEPISKAEILVFFAPGPGMQEKAAR